MWLEYSFKLFKLLRMNHESRFYTLVGNAQYNDLTMFVIFRDSLQKIAARLYVHPSSSVYLCASRAMACRSYINITYKITYIFLPTHYFLKIKLHYRLYWNAYVFANECDFKCQVWNHLAPVYLYIQCLLTCKSGPANKAYWYTGSSNETVMAFTAISVIESKLQKTVLEKLNLNQNSTATLSDLINILDEWYPSNLVSLPPGTLLIESLKLKWDSSFI